MLLTRFLSSLLFGVSATDPLTFVAVSLPFVVVAALACLIPARKAAHVDPLLTLRGEREPDSREAAEDTEGTQRDAEKIFSADSASPLCALCG